MRYRDVIGTHPLGEEAGEPRPPLTLPQAQRRAKKLAKDQQRLRAAEQQHVAKVQSIRTDMDDR